MLKVTIVADSYDIKKELPFFQDLLHTKFTKGLETAPERLFCQWRGTLVDSEAGVTRRCHEFILHGAVPPHFDDAMLRDSVRASLQQVLSCTYRPRFKIEPITPKGTQSTTTPIQTPAAVTTPTAASGSSSQSSASTSASAPFASAVESAALKLAQCLMPQPPHQQSIQLTANDLTALEMVLAAIKVNSQTQSLRSNELVKMAFSLKNQRKCEAANELLQQALQNLIAAESKAGGVAGAEGSPYVLEKLDICCHLTGLAVQMQQPQNALKYASLGRSLQEQIWKQELRSQRVQPVLSPARPATLLCLFAESEIKLENLQRTLEREPSLARQQIQQVADALLRILPCVGAGSTQPLALFTLHLLLGRAFVMLQNAKLAHVHITSARDYLVPTDIRAVAKWTLQYSEFCRTFATTKDAALKLIVGSPSSPSSSSLSSSSAATATTAPKSPSLTTGITSPVSGGGGGGGAAAAAARTDDEIDAMFSRYFTANEPKTPVYAQVKPLVEKITSYSKLCSDMQNLDVAFDSIKLLISQAYLMMRADKPFKELLKQAHGIMLNALALDSSSAKCFDVVQSLADAHLRSDTFDEAIDILKKLTRVADAPVHVQVRYHHQLALLHKDQCDLSEAQAHVRECISLLTAPGRANSSGSGSADGEGEQRSWMQLSSIYELQGDLFAENQDHTPAARSYEQSIEICRKHKADVSPDALVNLGEMYLQLWQASDCPWKEYDQRAMQCFRDAQDELEGEDQLSPCYVSSVIGIHMLSCTDDKATKRSIDELKSIKESVSEESAGNVCVALAKLYQKLPVDQQQLQRQSSQSASLTHPEAYLREALQKFKNIHDAYATRYNCLSTVRRSIFFMLRTYVQLAALTEKPNDIQQAAGFLQMCRSHMPPLGFSYLRLTLCCATLSMNVPKEVKDSLTGALFSKENGDDASSCTQKSPETLQDAYDLLASTLMTMNLFDQRAQQNIDASFSIQQRKQVSGNIIEKVNLLIHNRKAVSVA